MMKKTMVLKGAVLLALASAAQADGYIGTAAVARRDPALGFELEFGYRLTLDRLGLNLMPVGGIFYADGDNRFRYQSGNSVATSHCTDSGNGREVNDTLCSANRLSYAGSVSADLTLTRMIAVGAGVRLGRDADGFALLRLNGDKGVGLQVRVGASYWSLGGSYAY